MQQCKHIPSPSPKLQVKQPLRPAGRNAPNSASADAAAAAALPAVVAGPDAVAFAQGATLLLGAGASLALTRKLGKCGWGEGLGAQALMIGGFTAALWGVLFPCYQ